MAKIAVDKKDQPLSEVIVSNCGELERLSKLTAAPRVPIRKTGEELPISKKTKNGRSRRYSTSNSSATSRYGSQSPSYHHKMRKRSQTPRRRSDVGLDENRRGRTSTRSVSPHEHLHQSWSRHRQDRRRSSPPSRSWSPRRSRSPHLRRRLTDRDRSPQYGGSSRQGDRGYKVKHDQMRRIEHQDRQRNEKGFNGGENYNSRMHDELGECNGLGRRDDRRLRGSCDDVEEPGIKFKGRGSMKYRERGW